MKNNFYIFRNSKLGVSLRINQQSLLIFCILTIITFLAMVVNISYGEYPIPILAAIQTLLGIDTGNFDYGFVIYNLRLPRTLVASCVGMALAISGTILQGITRNPLADASVIGVNAGAGLAAVSVIILLPSLPLGVLPLSAFVGAFASALLIYLLAFDRGTHPVRLILIGVGIAAAVKAVTNLLITFGEIYDVSQALVWLAGSVNGRTWEQFFYLLPWLIVFIPLAFINSTQLNALALGDDIAKNLGIKIELQRSWLLLISSALAGAAVATAGDVSFIGLIAPHIARQLTNDSYEGLLPITAIIGAILIVISDFLGRVLFAPLEIPCGVITAIIGAPYFIFLLIKNRKK
ncbi:MAG TPA: iron ABC transporter permease [Nostocaceae cyanobacterium]|nr:iron ABC transporter permease [Nostocaceae cyanobacterium]